MKPLQQKHWRKKLTWVFSCAVLLFAAAFTLAHNETVFGRSLPAPVPASGNADEDQAQMLRKALANQALSAVDRAALEKKLELIDRLVTQRANGQGKAGSKGSGSLIPPVLPPQSQPPVGILPGQDEIMEGSEGLVRPWEAAIQNLWQGERGGVYYQALAGAAPDDPSQGLILLIESRQQQNQRIQHFYLAPSSTGALRVISARGMQLILSTANGGQVIFDLSARTFQNGN